MKARDTVMGLEQREIFMARAHKTVAEYLGKNIPDIKLSDIDDTAKQICRDTALEELEAQAEISFRAGQKEGRKGMFLAGDSNGYLRGIREVVEWIEKVKGEEYYTPWEGIKAKRSIVLDKELWQAQLKEWGI